MATVVGQRVAVDGHVGTVLYVGDVAGSDGTWLGIEWDDPARGKHNGSHEGRAYFTTQSVAPPSHHFSLTHTPRHPTGGSFVRPRKVDTGVSFLAALRAQYSTTDETRPDEKFVVQDSRNVAVAVEVLGNSKLEQRLK